MNISRKQGHGNPDPEQDLGFNLHHSLDEMILRTGMRFLQRQKLYQDWWLTVSIGERNKALISLTNSYLWSFGPEQYLEMSSFYCHWTITISIIITSKAITHINRVACCFTSLKYETVFQLTWKKHRHKILDENQTEREEQLESFFSKGNALVWSESVSLYSFYHIQETLTKHMSKDMRGLTSYTSLKTLSLYQMDMARTWQLLLLLSGVEIWRVRNRIIE